MKPIWVIQENLNDDDKVLLPLLEELGVEYRLLRIIPFSEEVPPVDYAGPIIVRGSTTILKAAERAKWLPGVWHNQNFSTRYYAQAFGENYVNFSGQQLRFCDVTDEKLQIIYGEHQHVFVRPNSDYKDFTGEPMTRREILKLARGVSQGHYPIESTSEIMFAPLRRIESEFRMTIVGGEVIAGNSYRVNRNRRFGVEAPQEVWDFARTLPLTLAEVFSLDIGLTDDGPKVIEANCFNASGIYGTPRQIVQAVTNLVTERYS